LLKFCGFGVALRKLAGKQAALSNRTDRASRRLQVKIGVPKEIKTHEYRVGLTPGAIREYVAAGHGVVVETNAGAGIGATDDDYRGAGATILRRPVAAASPREEG
jgi:alanine dehydrogenase/PNT-like protein